MIGALSQIALRGGVFRMKQRPSRRAAVSPRTLERWRSNRTGPRFICLGGRVVYRMSDVLAFEQAHLSGG